MDSLRAVSDWLEPWTNAIVDCLYLRDRHEAERFLSDARTALTGESDLSEDQRTACALRLDYLEYQTNKALGGPEEWGQAFGEALEAISRPVEGPAADTMQRVLLTLLRSSGMRAGFQDFTPAEFHAIFDPIPDEHRGSELWHAVANWAYHLRDAEALGLAFEFFTVSADGWLSDYTWQHVNCMYQLVTGKAIERDVQELLNRITLTPQMENFNKHIWPLAVERGLATPEMERLRRLRSDIVAREGAYVPRKELRTKSAVNRV